MGITIDHVALMVSDLERSREFYCDLLGLEVVSPEEHNDGPISEMVAMERVHMREYRLRAPGGVNGHRRSAEQGFTFDLISGYTPRARLAALRSPRTERPHLLRRGGRAGDLREAARGGG